MQFLSRDEVKHGKVSSFIISLLKLIVRMTVSTFKHLNVEVYAMVLKSKTDFYGKNQKFL